jgi:microcystin-dependent protein
MPNVSLLTSGIGDVNRGGSLVPTGTVFSFAGSTAPSGWLVCDGAEYSQTTYSSLFAVLGSTYNTQTNPTTNAAWATPTGGTFRVPDYRGIFLRSSGQASGQTAVTVGGHQNQSTAKNGLGATTGEMSANASHSHKLSNANIGGSSYLSRGGGNIATYATASEVESTNIDHTHVVTITGDSETRPINKGVIYIIKV